MRNTPKFAEMSLLDLLTLNVKITEELRNRNVIRTANNITGDLAEHLFCTAFCWTQAPNSERGFDATDTDGKRYQIKGRRVHRRNPSRQLSALRNIENKQFEFLAGIIFDDNYRVTRAAIIPHSIVVAQSTFVEHTNSSRFMLNDRVWSEKGVLDVTGEIRAVFPYS